MGLPIPLKILALAVNCFLPDFVPFLDEIIMAVGLLGHISRFFSITEFISKYKVAIIIVIVLAIVCFCVLKGNGLVIG